MSVCLSQLLVAVVAFPLLDIVVDNRRWVSYQPLGCGVIGGLRFVSEIGLFEMSKNKHEITHHKSYSAILFVSEFPVPQTNH